eukprot:4634986-Pyramimonas_sp.AAC.1
MTPCLQVCPCAAWAVTPKAGTSGNCRLLNLSRGCGRPLSTNHSFFCGTTGCKPGALNPSTFHLHGFRPPLPSSPSSNNTKITLG